MGRNTFFRFKQFTVSQDRCAMKVCTDACVFGAWAGIEKVNNVLDIGTGTGLLALMAAQRNPDAAIDAVEIEEGAFGQAVRNIADSPFGNRISVFHTAVQRFFPAARYDSILVNPPFFQNDLRTADEAAATAHHAVSLDFETLEREVARLLVQSGCWHVLLPSEEAGLLQKYVSMRGWYAERELLLVHKPGMRPFRRMATYRRHEALFPQTRAETEPESLFIYQDDGRTYDPAFMSLLKAFYLAF